MRIAMMGLAALLLTGCFTSEGSLYRGVTPLAPFHAGVVVSRGKDGKIAGHMALRKDAAGAYRLTITDKGEDFGEGYLLRFFPLAGAASGTLMFEALELCKPNDKSCKPPTQRLYGLLRVTQRGAEEFSPDCAKDSPVRAMPGVKSDRGSDCAFGDRATLEKALLTVAKRNPQPDVIYSFQ